MFRLFVPRRTAIAGLVALVTALSGCIAPVEIEEVGHEDSALIRDVTTPTRDNPFSCWWQEDNSDPTCETEEPILECPTPEPPPGGGWIRPKATASPVRADTSPRSNFTIVRPGTITTKPPREPNASELMRCDTGGFASGCAVCSAVPFHLKRKDGNPDILQITDEAHRLAPAVLISQATIQNGQPMSKNFRVHGYAAIAWAALFNIPSYEINLREGEMLAPHLFYGTVDFDRDLTLGLTTTNDDGERVPFGQYTCPKENNYCYPVGLKNF